MTLHWPQITYIVLSAIGLGESLARHGKPRENENAVTSLISLGIWAWLLYEGGFFG
jgi:hypothetical protein